VNSLGHYSFKHKSLGSVIPSFKKISMFMWGNTNRNLYEDYYFVGCDTMQSGRCLLTFGGMSHLHFYP
jgi:hypothetical protein